METSFVALDGDFLFHNQKKVPASSAGTLLSFNFLISFYDKGIPALTKIKAKIVAKVKTGMTLR